MKDSNIKLLIMDVDGTLTDGKVYMSEHGELFKAFDIKDSLLSELALDYSNCAYIGDDINDLSCMRKVALVGCPADSVRDVISISDFVSSKNGGCGAVRDFIEWLVE